MNGVFISQMAPLRRRRRELPPRLFLPITGWDKLLSKTKQKQQIISALHSPFIHGYIRPCDGILECSHVFYSFIYRSSFPSWWRSWRPHIRHSLDVSSPTNRRNQVDFYEFPFSFPTGLTFPIRDLFPAPFWHVSPKSEFVFVWIRGEEIKMAEWWYHTYLNLTSTNPDWACKIIYFSRLLLWNKSQSF